MKTIINNKGFSLIELLVAMGLIGVLTAIAIPAYNNYRETANTTVLKSDSGNAYKAYHSFNAVNGHFCASLSEAGLTSLVNSQTYKKDGITNSFVGFGAENCSESSVTAASVKESKGTPPTITDCVLNSGNFIFGVQNEFGGTAVGFFVNNSNNAPTSSGGSCSKTACNAKSNPQTACGQKTDAQCDADSSGTKGTWTAVSKVCKD